MYLKVLIFFLLRTCFVYDHLCSAQQLDLRYKLIAHRGGVVDSQHIEHSLPSLQAAIDRGYWMVEIDIRETRDGIPILHHDRDFLRYYDYPGQVAEMSWDEIRQLRSTPGNHRPLKLSEFADACRDKIRVMLEIKGPDHDEKYYQQIESIMRENNLLEEAYLIGIDEAKDYFRGKLRNSVQQNSLAAAIAAGEDVANTSFLFQGAYKIAKHRVAFARSMGVPIVAAVNKHHYRGENAMQQAQSDVQRMKKLGIHIFQIDSIYDRWLLK